VFGQVTSPHTPGPHRRRRVLNAIDILFIQEMIETDPSTHLDKLQHKLAVAHGIHVSIATISRTLSCIGLTRKAISRRTSERNDTVWVLWELEMAQSTDPDPFVFLDESAVDGQTGLRTNGWSPPNTLAVKRSTFRGVRHSILPALTLQGMIDDRSRGLQGFRH
jgi:hypothetical protein